MGGVGLKRLAWMAVVDRNRNEFGRGQSSIRALSSGDPGGSRGDRVRERILVSSGVAGLLASCRGAWRRPELRVLGPGEVRPFRPTEPMTAVAELQRRGRVRMALWNIPALTSLEADHKRETGEYRFESLVAFASARGVVLPEPELDDPSNYYEGSKADITGLIGVIEEGCGHMTAVAIQPPDVGRVITVGGDGGVGDGSIVRRGVRPLAEWSYHHVFSLDPPPRFLG